MLKTLEGVRNILRLLFYWNNTQKLKFLPSNTAFNFATRKSVTETSKFIQKTGDKIAHIPPAKK